MVETITRKPKREGQRKAKRCSAHKNQRRERASPSCGLVKVKLFQVYRYHKFKNYDKKPHSCKRKTQHAKVYK
jgi:hypothetical protein